MRSYDKIMPCTLSPAPPLPDPSVRRIRTDSCSLKLFIGLYHPLPLPRSQDLRRVWACRGIPLNPGMIAHNRHAPASRRRRASEAVHVRGQPGAPLIFLHSILISVTMSHCDLPSLFPLSSILLVRPLFCPPGDFLDPPRERERQSKSRTPKIHPSSRSGHIIP